MRFPDFEKTAIDNKFPFPTRPICYTLAVVGVAVGSAFAFFSNNEAGAMGGGGNPAAVMLRTETQEMGEPHSPSTIWRRIHLTEQRGSEQGHDYRRREHRESGLAVCVRLCDGSFFPSNTASGGDAACNAQCPDAPTALYVEPPGSSTIEEAVSTSGALYSDLPVAGRYRKVFDSTCTCRRDRASYSAMLLHDPTLRRGDAVMTPKGVVVYEGSNVNATRPEDFVALAQETRLPGNVREYLSTMRSAFVEAGQFGGRTAAANAVGSMVARKGSIRVESYSETR